MSKYGGVRGLFLNNNTVSIVIFFTVLRSFSIEEDPRMVTHFSSSGCINQEKTAIHTSNLGAFVCSLLSKGISRPVILPYKKNLYAFNQIQIDGAL